MSTAPAKGAVGTQYYVTVTSALLNCCLSVGLWQRTFPLQHLWLHCATGRESDWWQFLNILKKCCVLLGCWTITMGILCVKVGSDPMCIEKTSGLDCQKDSWKIQTAATQGPTSLTWIRTWCFKLFLNSRYLAGEMDRSKWKGQRYERHARQEHALLWLESYSTLKMANCSAKDQRQIYTLTI